QIEARLLETERLFRRVEFDDDVVLAGRLARRGKLDDLEVAADRRRDQLNAPAGTQLARGVNRDLDAPALNARGRNGACRRGRDAGPGKRERGSYDDDRTQRGDTAPGHRAGPSASGSFVATRSPSRTPSAIAI